MVILVDSLHKFHIKWLGSHLLDTFDNKAFETPFQEISWNGLTRFIYYVWIKETQLTFIITHK